jgi:hypothetical protein
MHARSFASIVTGIGLLLAHAVAGSEAWTYKAFQPFDLSNGYALSAVTYVGFYQASQQVEMACWENRIWHPESRTVVQENAAFAAGLHADVSQEGWPNHGDTLRCSLDASRMSQFKSENGWSADELLDATAECLKASAGQIEPARYLALSVKRRGISKPRTEVFDLREYRCGPRPR